MTGIYKSKIEVMFDEPFIGANNLSGRCEFFRGALVDFLDLYNMTEWKRFVNTKKNQYEKVANLYQKQKRKDQILPHERLAEWDGKLDGMLLIKQMSRMKEDSFKQDTGDNQKPKLKPNSGAYSGEQMLSRSNFTASSTPSQPVTNQPPRQYFGNQPQSSGAQPGKQGGQTEVKPQFDLNPTHKLKPKAAKKPQADEPMYVVKQQSAPFVPEGVPAKPAQPSGNTGSKGGALTADDLEKQMALGAQKPSTGVRIEDLEAQLRGGK